MKRALLALLLALPGSLQAAASAEAWLERMAAQAAPGERWSPALGLAEPSTRRHYDARLAGTGEVAGEPAQVLTASARDAWRFGYRLWLAQAGGRLLRVDTLGENGEVLERSEAPGPARRAAPAQALGPDAAPARRDTAGWFVPSPPAGFTLRAGRQDHHGVHLLYGDGVANVSVYIEAVSPGYSGTSASQRGALHARDFWVDGWRIVAVGRVPAATVDRFARTVTRERGGG